MKLRLVVAICTTLLIGCAKNGNEVAISGQLIGELPRKLGYTVPVNSTCFHFFNNEIDKDSGKKYDNGPPRFFINILFAGR